MNITILQILLWGMTISLLIIGKPFIALANFIIAPYIIGIMSNVDDDKN